MLLINVLYIPSGLFYCNSLSNKPSLALSIFLFILIFFFIFFFFSLSISTFSMNHTLTTKKVTSKQPQSKLQPQKKKARPKNAIAKQEDGTPLNFEKQNASITTTTTIPTSNTVNVATASQSSFATPSSSSSSFFPSETLLPLPNASTNGAFIETNNEQNENETQLAENTTQNQAEERPEKISSMAAAVSADSPTYSTSNTLPANDNHIARIAGPIVGIFAGVAFLAVAMFIVVRNRNRRISALNKSREDEEDEGNSDNKFHDISLNDDDDEGIAVMKRMPSLIVQQQSKHEQTFASKKLSFISTTSTAYHSMSSTLVASRSNSVSTKQQVNQQRHESWQSAKSHQNDRNSDIMTLSPNSTTFSERVQSFLMTAERQKLFHEKPNLLNHFEYHPHSKPPIETYKAQLANILEPEEDSSMVINNELPFPFSSLMDIKEYY